MPAAPAASVKGLRDLQRACALASKDVKKKVRAELRDIAEPIRATAESFAVTRISGMTAGRRRPSKWQGMRIGVTRNLIYVAPKRRGIKSPADPRKRGGQFAQLLMDQAMDPALDIHRPLVESRIDRALGQIANDWERRP